MGVPPGYLRFETGEERLRHGERRRAPLSDALSGRDGAPEGGRLAPASRDPVCLLVQPRHHGATAEAGRAECRDGASTASNNIAGAQTHRHMQQTRTDCIFMGHMHQQHMCDGLPCQLPPVPSSSHAAASWAGLLPAVCAALLQAPGEPAADAAAPHDSTSTAGLSRPEPAAPCAPGHADRSERREARRGAPPGRTWVIFASIW